jgi:hypothetical protein
LIGRRRHGLLRRSRKSDSAAGLSLCFAKRRRIEGGVAVPRKIDKSRIESLRGTRRSILRVGVAAAGALPFLGLSGGGAKAAKVSQAAVGYQGSPKGSQSCANCRLFEPPNACKQVDGVVSPSGWCRIWSKA